MQSARKTAPAIVAGHADAPITSIKTTNGSAKK
jgi:hypothetical protein